MDSRERVLRAIHFQNPDRLPVSHAVLPATQLKYGSALQRILTEFREDFGWEDMLDLPPEKFPAPYRAGRNVDEFGTVWRSETLGVCGIPVEWPLGDLSLYPEYLWPSVFKVGSPEGRLYSGHRAGFDPRWYARGAWITYFEQLQQLRGMENVLIDLVKISSAFERLLDDLLEFNLRWIPAWTSQAYDGLHFADDWGSQTSLLIHPRLWRQIFKPRYAEMFSMVHQAGMDVWFHSDGKINAILPDLVEIGVNVINCQNRLVGHDWIASNLRGAVAFRTDIDRQFILPFGSPEEVRDEVFRTFNACGSPEGGIIACGEIGPDVPLENISAMYQAFRDYLS